MRKLLLASAITWAAIGATQVSAAFPERPIAFIIGFGAGGNTDIGGRTVVEHLEPCLGPDASIVPQNMTGASGEIAFGAIASGPVDGHQIGVITFPRGVITPIVKQVPWTIDSFTYLGTLIGASSTLSVSKQKDWKTVDDLIAASKAAPNGLSVGMSGVGSEDHLMLLRFAQQTGIKFNYIPFDGDAAAFTAVMGGHIDLVSAASPSTSRYLADLRPIFVAAEERQPDLLPDTPTLKELGYDIVAGSTHVISGPAGMSEEAKTKLGGCIEKLATDSEFLADAKKRSLLILPMNAERSEAFVRDLDKTLRQLWETQPWDPN